MAWAQLLPSKGGPGGMTISRVGGGEGVDPILLPGSASCSMLCKYKSREEFHNLLVLSFKVKSRYRS